MSKSIALIKKEYILAQLSRTIKKKYENYVITRIVHLLNDQDIKFVTQQYFKRPDGNFGLTDLYFPQFNLSIEIDEGHHSNLHSMQKDKIRDRDYLVAIKNLKQHPEEWSPKRIKAYKDCSLNMINTQIDKVVKYIQDQKNQSPNFTAWDPESEYNYEGISIFKIEDQIVFKRIVDAINYFRNNTNQYKGYQSAAAETMDGKRILWFPKLFKNEDWNNSISKDENWIEEIPISLSKGKNHLNRILSSKSKQNRIVFAKVKDNLGFINYKFKGYYELDVIVSKKKGYCCYERKSTSVSLPDGKPIQN